MKQHKRGALHKKTMALCIATVLVAGSFLIYGNMFQSDAYQVPADEFRGVWVPTVFSLSYPSKATTSSATLKQDAIKILDNAKAMGFNAVIFQVRPSNDALYQSNLFPWSKYLTGKEGTAPSDGFDPLAFFVTEAHKRGLELHAWINPYRITSAAADNATLSVNNPARLHPDWVVTHSDGKMYWNPGEPGARQLIADGVKEIVTRYDVDGVQIDDYFYPDKNFEDGAAFAKYGSGFSDISAWRRDNNDQMVKALYDAVHSAGPDKVFGISPIGIWANKSTTALGSDTRGQEAYTQKYADTRGWVKKGYLDYIAPQIYWNIGYDIADYKTLSTWWSDVVSGTDVKLYIGQAAYRAGNADSKSPWYGVSEIQRQIDLNRTNRQVSGYIMYSYSSFTANQDLFNLMKTINSSTGTTDPTTPVVPPQTTPPAAGNSGFTDLAGHWAAANFQYMSEKGIVKGNTENQAMPDNQMKRADFVLMLMRMLNIENKDGAQNFSDVDANAYYAVQLATAKEIGLISGVGDNKFAPESMVTRQDMFTMTYKALEKMDKLSGTADASVLNRFSDAKSIGSYAQAPMAYFIDKKIISGMADGSLLPEKTATRADTVTFLANIMKTL